jgi:hypothetical protein
VIALALASACKGDPAPSDAERPGLLAVLADELLGDAHVTGPGHELLIEYRHAVEEAVLAENAKSDVDVDRIARRIIQERLVPATATLHEHARWGLQHQPPRARSLELDGWSGTGQTMVGASLADATALAKPPTTDDERADRVERGWNPVGVAWAVDRDVVKDRPTWRFLLDELAPPDTVFLGEDLDAPTIVIDSVDALAIVKLRWDQRGFFLPIGYERYVRTALVGVDPANRAPRGDLAAGQGPSYDVLIEFHRAVQLAVATASFEGDAERRVREIAARVAEERLLPHSQALRERAKWILRRWVPRADAGRWTAASPPVTATDLVTIVDVGIDELPEAQRPAARLLVGWDPLTLAQALRWALAMRARSGDDTSMFFALQRHAWPQQVLVDDDPDAPTIGFEGARERLVVRLRWDPQGWYVPVEAVTERRDAP